MRYIIMAGGIYRNWKSIRQLTRVNGEPIVARTIRLLRENGIDDIAISSNVPDVFEQFGVPVLKHKNSYDAKGYNDFKGYWCDAFYPTAQPACYLCGDVVFSDEAIKKIIATETDDIEFFASAPPFAENYPKKYAEPFAFKVQNQSHLHKAIAQTRWLADHGKFNRKPIAWELWQVIKRTPLNKIDYTNYTAINDYTCDIDYEEEAKLFEDLIGKPVSNKTQYLIHTLPSREWYVRDYLIPSMLKQGIEESQITVYSDVKKEGNLKAWIEASKLLDESREGTWHLQDDILLSKDFKEITEKYDKGIVCAFKSKYDGQSAPSGVVPIKQMWWSFPCIRIPNKMYIESAQYTERYMIGNPVYRDWWKDGKSDDKFFRMYVFDHYKNEKALNLNPNIVEHIDFLINGSTHSSRDHVVRSLLWDDEKAVKELDETLQKRKQRNKWENYNRRILERS